MTIEGLKKIAMPPEVATWMLPSSLQTMMHTYREMMESIDYLRGCELAFIPAVNPGSTRITDVHLFAQQVTPISVDYTPQAMQELAGRIKGVRAGMIHFHPGSPQPSPKDYKVFEELTLESLAVNPTSTWESVTAMFRGNGDYRLEGDGEVLVLQRTAYQFFLIYGSNSSQWIGVGQARVSALYPKPLYTLYTAGNNAALEIIQESVSRPATMEHLLHYVKPQEQVYRPAIAQILEETSDPLVLIRKMPLTVPEFAALVKTHLDLHPEIPKDHLLWRMYEVVACIQEQSEIYAVFEGLR